MLVIIKVVEDTVIILSSGAGKANLGMRSLLRQGYAFTKALQLVSHGSLRTSECFGQPGNPQFGKTKLCLAVRFLNFILVESLIVFVVKFGVSRGVIVQQQKQLFVIYNFHIMV